MNWRVRELSMDKEKRCSMLYSIKRQLIIKKIEHFWVHTNNQKNFHNQLSQVAKGLYFPYIEPHILLLNGVCSCLGQSCFRVFTRVAAWPLTYIYMRLSSWKTTCYEHFILHLTLDLLQPCIKMSNSGTALTKPYTKKSKTVSLYCMYQQLVD